MKRKIQFVLLALLVISGVSFRAHADTDSGESGSGGSVNCEAPYSNTCIIIHRPFPFGDDVRKGVATLRY